MMNNTTAVDFETIVQTLSKRFSTVVKTSEAFDYLISIGVNANKHYNRIRDTYSVGHGKLLFPQLSSTAMASIDPTPVYEETQESDFVIEKRITKRFNALDVMARATANGTNRAMIVSGPAGLGKSFGVERAAQEAGGDFQHVKGYIRPTGLYKLLYENREAGSLIVFDDIDSLFNDENSLNILKAACDSSDVREISWRSNAIMETEDGEIIPNSFEFEGSIIFITNLDFQVHIEKGSRMAPHFEALISRSHYLDLGIKTNRDYIVRIKQVLRTGMLSDVLEQEDKDEIVEFMETNMNQMRELSLRMVKKLADLMIMDRDGWKDLAEITCMKNS